MNLKINTETQEIEIVTEHGEWTERVALSDLRSHSDILYWAASHGATTMHLPVQVIEDVARLAVKYWGLVDVEAELPAIRRSDEKSSRIKKQCDDWSEALHTVEGIHDHVEQAMHDIDLSGSDRQAGRNELRRIRNILVRRFNAIAARDPRNRSIGASEDIPV
jgi:hypothetical protein